MTNTNNVGSTGDVKSNYELSIGLVPMFLIDGVAHQVCESFNGEGSDTITPLDYIYFNSKQELNAILLDLGVRELNKTNRMVREVGLTNEDFVAIVLPSDNLDKIRIKLLENKNYYLEFCEDRGVKLDDLKTGLFWVAVGYYSKKINADKCEWDHVEYELIPDKS